MKQTTLLLFAAFFVTIFSTPSHVYAEDIQKEKRFIYDDHGNRDPFWELVTSSGAVISYETDYVITDLVLEGIMSGEADKSLAIINGRVVRQGEKIGNFVVLKVSGNTVVVQDGQQKFELRLKKED